MACKISIERSINRIIDEKLPEGQLSPEAITKDIVRVLNDKWGIEISQARLVPGGSMLVKYQPGIQQVVELEYIKQLETDKKLTPPENNIEEPLIKQELEQFKPLNAKFFSILAKYNADSLGVIHPENRKDFTYSNLQDDLNKEFGEIFVVKVDTDNSYYVSKITTDSNVVIEEGNKVISKAFSNSISKTSGVPSKLVKLADKLKTRFNSKIKIISKKQAEEFKIYREGTVGFYDPVSMTSYVVYENMKETTLLHEAFSHPFIIYVKQNYNALYQTLLEKAKANTQVKSEVDAYYGSYSQIAKDMEYISHAIDLEMENQLKDASLIKSILRFWERIIAYIKYAFNMKEDISKFSTFKDVLKFALNSKEKLDLTNTELLDLQIMESFVNADEDADFDNINEPNLETRSSIDIIREAVAEDITKMQESVQKMKDAIISGETELSTGEKDQIDTITSRILTLSKDLFASNRTEAILKKDKNLYVTIQYFSNIIKGSLNAETAITDEQEALKSLSNISQVMEEALVLTRYIKEKITAAQKSTAQLEIKQREIHQYYQIMQAIESSLKELYDFYVKTERDDTDLINPVVQVVNAIFSDIKNAKDINSKYVIDYWAERIVKALGTEENNKIIDKDIERNKEQIKSRLQRLKNATTEKKQNEINKEISDLNILIEQKEQSKVTLQNIKAIINGDYGDSNYLYYKFMAAFNSPNLVISGAAAVIEEYFMTGNDDTQKAVNEMNRILQAYKEATGQTDSSKFNVETFSRFLIRKAKFNKLKTNTKYNNVEGQIPGQVIEEKILEETLEEVSEDVILTKFMVHELNAKLKEFEFHRNQAIKSRNPILIQKTSQALYDFREKYFITAVTSEFNKRTVNSNLITEEDIKDLYDENGEALSLTKDPDLIYAAKAILEPLYEKENMYTTISKARVPTELEVAEYQANERLIKEVASYEILGTTTKKTGKAMAIARAINRSRELKRGVFDYKVYPSAKAKYFDTYARHKKAIKDKIKAKEITKEEGIRDMNNWHKMHSKITIDPKYFEIRNNLRQKLDDAFQGLTTKEDGTINELFNFIEGFGFEDKSKTQKDTLSALWNEVYDFLNPLKDLEGIVDGRLANEDLQIKMKQAMELIDSYQGKKDSIIKLTNASDFEKYFKVANNVFVTSSKGNKIRIENFNRTEKVASLKGTIQGSEFNKTGFNALQRELNTIKSAEYVSQSGESRELPENSIKYLQNYLFRTSEYAEKFALAQKIELSKETELSVDEYNEIFNLKGNEKKSTLTKEEKENGLVNKRKNLLNKAIEREFQIVLGVKNEDGEPIKGSYENYNRKSEFNKVYDELEKYNELVSKLFDQLSKLSERVSTQYYDLVVDNMKAKIFQDNYAEIIEKYKDQIGYYELEKEEQEELELNIQLINSLTYSNYTKLKDFVDEKFKATDWYKNNHYKKLKKSSTVRYEYFPTPLWTQSIPTNKKFSKIEPNNSYKTRSVNEFLMDENGNPTNIRLKRGDTKIKAKAGDTLETLSQYYNIELDSLKQMNPTLVGPLEEDEEVVIKEFGSRAFGNKEPREYLEDGTLSEYIDPEYRRLETENPKLIEVIDSLNKIYSKHQVKSGMRGLELFQIIPRIEAKGWEVLLDENGFTTKKIISKTKNLFKSNQQDFDSGYGRADFADKILESIPLKFVSDIPYEMRSRDVFGNIVKFIAHANEVSQLNILYPTIKELHRIADENSPAVKSEKRVKKRSNPFGVKKEVIIREKSGHIFADHLLHLINTQVLGEKSENVVVAGFNIGKAAHNLSGATSFGALGGFITPNIIMNYIVGKTQIWIEIWSGGVINKNDYNSGIQAFYKYIASDFNNDFYKLGEKSLTGQLLIRYNPSAKSSLELFGNELQKTPFKDYASADIFFKTRRLSEFELSGGPTFGILSKYRVMDNGVEISLLDAYELDSNNNIQIKPGLKKLDGTDFTREDENRIRIKNVQLNMIIQGNYSSHHKTQFDTTLLGQMVLFFRKHIPSYIEKAWSVRHFNYALGDYVEGYQRKLWGTAIQMAKAIKNRDAEQWNEALTEAKSDWENSPTLKKAAIHNGILGLIYILLAIIGSDDDDDNKKSHSYDSFFAKALLYQLMRLKSDLELASAIPFVAGLNESLNIIKSPSIVIDKTMVNLVKIGSHLIDYGEYKLGMIPEKEVILKRDYYSFKKGQLKILKDLGSLTGITGGTFNPDQMVNNLQNINSALFR